MKLVIGQLTKFLKESGEILLLYLTIYGKKAVKIVTYVFFFLPGTQEEAKNRGQKISECASRGQTVWGC